MEKEKIYIAPSILSADFGNMGAEIAKMEKIGADFVHCDVMDGEFVPNITFGFKMIKDIRRYTSLPLDVHLMIARPERYVERFIESGADYLTIHYEACECLRETLELIKSKNVKCGVVISPDTPVSALENSIALCDIVLLMSVYPGFGGQKFIEKSLDRLAQIKEMAQRLNPNVLIEIDGGVTTENAPAIIKAGATALVAGNTIFSSPDPSATIKMLRG